MKHIDNVISSSPSRAGFLGPKGYYLCEDQLVIAFGLFRYRIKYCDIESVEIRPPQLFMIGDIWHGYFRDMFAVKWDGSDFCPNLLIIKKRGMTRKHRICPKDVEAFRDQIIEQMNKTVS